MQPPTRRPGVHAGSLAWSASNSWWGVRRISWITPTRPSCHSSVLAKVSWTGRPSRAASSVGRAVRLHPTGPPDEQNVQVAWWRAGLSCGPGRPGPEDHHPGDPGQPRQGRGRGSCRAEGLGDQYGQLREVRGRLVGLDDPGAAHPDLRQQARAHQTGQLPRHRGGVGRAQQGQLGHGEAVLGATQQVGQCLALQGAAEDRQERWRRLLHNAHDIVCVMQQSRPGVAARRQRGQPVHAPASAPDPAAVMGR